MLFASLSICLYFYTGEKSFKYYGLYNFTIIIYFLTKNDYLFSLYLSGLENIFNTKDALNFTKYFNWYLQVIFYNFYFIFSIYFLDLEKHISVLSIQIKRVLIFLYIFFSVLFFVTFTLNNFNLFFNFFHFLYLPSVLILFVYLFPIALKKSGKHKYLFLSGLSIYVLFALISFYMTVLDVKTNSIFYFSIGIIIENFCFALGLAYKTKLANDELQQAKSLIALEKQQKEITKLEALIDGEENERKRIAQELHDGLNGDLSAIKYRLSTLEDSCLSAIHNENLIRIINMVDESCDQVRSISHNLMPASILEYGLVESIREYCLKINSSGNFKIDFQTFGGNLSFIKKTETVIYRIIQELVTNILKHAKATEAIIQFNHRDEELFITVEDNGIGFDTSKIYEGIGHKNIQTRIDFLNAQINVDSTTKGTSYTILIDLNKLK